MCAAPLTGPLMPHNQWRETDASRLKNCRPDLILVIAGAEFPTDRCVSAVYLHGMGFASDLASHPGTISR
jgi:hypothetical protein